MIFLFVGLALLWAVSLWFVWFLSQAYYARTYEKGTLAFEAAKNVLLTRIDEYRRHLLEQHPHDG